MLKTFRGSGSIGDAPAVMAYVGYRRFFFVAFFFFALFFFALGRDFLAAFFLGFFLAFDFAGARDGDGVGADIGAGVGADGNMGSMNPGPGQLLSEKSICSSIGCLPMLVGAAGRGYSLSRDFYLASDRRYLVLGLVSARRK